MNRPDELRTAWEQNAAAWHEFVSSRFALLHQALLSAVLARAGNVSGLTVLDAGCGNGVLTRELRRRGARASGVDNAEGNIAIARRLDPAGMYLVGDIAACPQPDAAFDLVVANMVLHGLDPVLPAFQEMRRVLAPGGRLVFTIYHPCFTSPGSGWVRAAKAPGSTPGDAPGKAPGKAYQVGPYREERFSAETLWGPAGPLPQPVPCFHRTLESWFALLAQAGFAVAGLQEPRAPDELAREIATLGTPDAVPLFMLIEAVPLP